MVFRIASSPYTHNQRQTSRIMMLVCLAALPGIAVQCWFFGWGTLFQIALGCASALIQYVMNWAQKRISATKATLIYAGEPVWAGVIGRIAGERLPALAIVGAILIIAAGILSEWRPKKARNTAEAVQP